MADERFENAVVEKRANVYYDGQVTSRELCTPEGDRYTLGIVLPGTYTFETDAREMIEILAGSGTIDRPDGAVPFDAGDVVTVSADTTFDFVADDVVDYCYSYD